MGFVIVLVLLVSVFVGGALVAHNNKERTDAVVTALDKDANKAEVKKAETKVDKK